jgi:DNA-binding GntR family transcriptional regulator
VTIQPLARQSFVTEHLRDSIENGSLVPGTPLSVVELAETFGVSRSTVHGALRRLVLEGLLRRGPGHQTFVPVLGDDDVRDLYLARWALESKAVRHVITTETSDTAADELERWVELMAASELAGDGQSARTYDLEFHTALVAAARSARLQRMFRAVLSETRLAFGLQPAASAHADRAAEHRRIALMIREQRTEEAVAALKKHFDDAVVGLLSHEGDSARKD